VTVHVTEMFIFLFYAAGLRSVLPVVTENTRNHRLAKLCNGGNF